MSDPRFAPPATDPTVVLPEGEAPLASRWLRFAGSVLDGLVMGAIASVVMGGSYLIFGEQAMAALLGESLMATLSSAVIGFGIFLLVNGYLLATRGQSVGKAAVGTRIVSADDGRLVPFGRIVLLRQLPPAFVGLLPFPYVILSLIDPLFIFRQDRRCIHDLIAGTKVVRAR